jgi:hypothetical protein
MRQTNPNLTVNQIKQFLFDTAVDYGSTGNDNDYGYGMIDAHQAVLKALDNLPARKSISTQATAYNGSRKLAKNGSNYYLVYESGNQIYFTKSTDNGSTWSDPPTRLAMDLVRIIFLASPNVPASFMSFGSARPAPTLTTFCFVTLMVLVGEQFKPLPMASLQVVIRCR